MKRSIIVIDANPATIRRAESAFDGVAHELVTARDAVEVNRKLRDVNEIVVALIAASLPNGNGYDLARTIRRRFPGATVLLMTSGFELFNQRRADEFGIVGHIAKPFSALNLRKRVEKETGALPLANRSTSEATPSQGSNGAAQSVTAQETAQKRYNGLVSRERIATILPRDYQELPLVQVDPEVVGPALERAVLEVLPEVVEAVLHPMLGSSAAFRELVRTAVEESVRSELPGIVRTVVRQRMAEIEAQATRTTD